MLKLHARAFALAAVLLLAGAMACVTELERNPSTATSVATATVPPTPESTSTTSPTVTVTPVTTPNSSPTPSATPTNIPVGGTIQRGLFLEIEGISDESVVHGDTVVARGQTASDAVVSISFPPSTNSIIVPVEPDGTFEVLLTLNPGPNLIEVVASNLDGEELSRVLAVVSIPEASTPTATPEGGASS